MKKIGLMLFMALFVFSWNGAWGQNVQWDVYNAIPYYKSISFVFDEKDAWEGYSSWSESDRGVSTKSGFALKYLTISDDYTVSLQYNSSMYLCYDGYNRSDISLTIYGNGMIRWQNDGMVLDLNVTVASTSGNESCSQYRDTRNGSVFDHQYYSFPAHKETKSYSYVIELCEQGFKLHGDDIKFVIVGTSDVSVADGASSRSGIPVYYKTCIKLTNRPFDFKVVEKSQSEINAQNSDMYGKWQWNKDRSRIYLESTTKDASLVIWNHKNEIGNLRNNIKEWENDTTMSWDLKQSMIEGVSRQIQRYQQNPIAWGFELGNGTGYKTEEADNGEELTYLMITFDGGSEQSFSFAKNDLGFEYVQYDRFMGTLKRDASILNQIKDKRIMIVNYKQNGSDKTAMFKLEGLEAIYNAITQ